MRVGIIALLHESNTFVSEQTKFEHFADNMLLTGEAIRRELADTHHEIGGFFDGLAGAQFEAVPIFAARAVPHGAIAGEAFQRLLQIMFNELEAVGDLDGVLVAPHGATVSETHRDADGYWLAELRARLGPDLPIIGTLDSHANLSQAMVEATNALIAYRTNPHLDQRARGSEAARLMARTLRGEIRPVQAADFPPLAINIERQMTGEPHLAAILCAADEMQTQPWLLSNSLLLGFPYADVEEMGTAILVVADSDVDLARDHARRLGSLVWDHRQEFVGQLIDVDGAIKQAATLKGPVCLLDMGDNVGGGAPGDSTHVIHALNRHKIGRALACLCDPETVRQAQSAGVGVKSTMQLGGKTDDLHGAPFVDDFEVLGLYDGRFTEPEPRHGGFADCDQGPSAVIRNRSGLTLLVTSLRMPPFSLQQLFSCDLDPSRFQAIVAKGVNAPVAAYQEVCPHFIRVNSQGCTTADMCSLEYQHRRRPLFPFEPQTIWRPSRRKPGQEPA